MNQQNHAFSETNNTIELTFTESERGKLPISRNKVGKICVIDYKSAMAKKVKPGETWECKITSSFPRKDIVDPVLLIFSKEHNTGKFENKLNALMQKYHQNK
jgi:hypothetical protein